MNELEQIKKMLVNIENLNEENRNYLKSKLLPFGYIETRDDLIDTYNLLNSNQMTLLIDLIGINSITEKFILNINNKKILPVIPYDFNSNLYYYRHIFKNEEATIQALSNELFYSKIEEFDLENILLSLNKEDLKTFFIDKCLSYKTDIILSSLKFKNNKIAKYISNDRIIKLMQLQTDSDTILNLYQHLNDQNKINVYKSDWFRNKIDINNFYNKYTIIENSPDELIKEMVKENDKLEPLYLLDMFINNRKTIFLKLFLDKVIISKSDDFILERTIEALFLINNKHWNELENYKQNIENLINDIPYDTYINHYCNKYRTFDMQSLELKNIMYDRASKILDKNNIKLSKISPNIYKNNDVLALNLIKYHLKLEDLLLLSIRNEYLNNYTLELLKNKPNLFKEIEVQDISKYPIFNNKVSEELFKNFLSIANYLDKEQLQIFFIPFYIKNSLEIKNYYIFEVTKKPNLLSSLEDLDHFDEDISKDILLTMDINKFMKLLLSGPLKLNNKIKNILSDVIYQRMFDISSFINNEDNHQFLSKVPNYNSLFRFLEREKQQELISLINDYSFLCRHLIEGTSQTKNLVIERLINLYNNDIEIDFMTDTPLFFKAEEEIDFFNKLSFSIVINIACNSLKYSDLSAKKDKKYIKYITEKIDKNINVLFDINILTKLEELLCYLPSDYQNKIKNYIDNKYNILKIKYPLLTKDINSYSEKANYILSIEEKYINDSTYNYVLDLLSKNKYLFNSMDFRLLMPDIINMGKYFIDKTSRHPIISSKLLKIYANDKEKYNLILNISNKINKENNNSIYDQKMELIIDYLLKNDIYISAEVDNKTLYNIETYILDQSLNNNLNYKLLNINNYVTTKNNLLDQNIELCNDLNTLKELIFQKYFGLNKQLIDDFILEYVYNWDSVAELCDKDLPNKYINSLNIINNINDLKTLKNISKNIPQYTISDYFMIKSIMANTYNKVMAIDIKNSIKGKEKTLKINDKIITVEELSNNFGIFVHSTDAYGSMPLINNDYYESWNYNPNTKNHGICTSYITNSSYGTANVKNNGVMFGFSNIDENSVPIMAPYDLATKNDGYTIKSHYKPFYARLKTISNFTRHTHNEVSLGRRIFDKSGFSALRQPDSIIIFEDMPTEIKENSIKAYEDFKKHGIELKIIYIDRVKNAKNEARKLELLISEFEKSYNLELLAEIINIYECNICGCDFLGSNNKNSLNLFDQHELFKTDKISNLLLNTFEYIKNIEDIEVQRNMFNKYMNILNNEQFKFSLIDDFNKQRKHTFDLINDNLKLELKNLEKNLSYGNQTIK